MLLRANFLLRRLVNSPKFCGKGNVRHFVWIHIVKLTCCSRCSLAFSVFTRLLGLFTKCPPGRFNKVQNFDIILSLMSTPNSVISGQLSIILISPVTPVLSLTADCKLFFESISNFHHGSYSKFNRPCHWWQFRNWLWSCQKVPD